MCSTKGNSDTEGREGITLLVKVRMNQPYPLIERVHLSHIDCLELREDAECQRSNAGASNGSASARLEIKEAIIWYEKHGYDWL